MQRGFVLSLVFPTLNAFMGIVWAALMYVGGWSVFLGAVSLGAWFLFIQSVDRFYFPILNLSALWAQVQAGLSASERVFALIDAEADVVQTDLQPASLLSVDIRFEQVDFHYTDKDPVLRGFDLHIQPGDTVALVGHTGAGKSSIAKLIARFYEFQGGRILIDEQDIRAFHALGMYAEAVGEYDKALQLCPNFPDIHNRRAASCRELQDYAGARASLARALELNPRYVEAYVNLGRLPQRVGHLTEAVAAWERALELNPTHPLARIYLTQAAASRAGGG